MTPAIRLLEKLKIAHRVVSYDHDPSADSYGSRFPGYGIEAIEMLGLDPDACGKTLLARLDDGSLVVAVVPVSHQLDLKALAKAAGAKKAAMADPADAERSSGYVVGGISPLGQRKRLRTFVDGLLTEHAEVHVSGGRRGLEVALAPDDLVSATSAIVADVRV